MSAAAQQAWPAFVLVSGLLLIGLVASVDGLFEQAGALLQSLAGPAPLLLGACAALIAVVTAVLNLDTAVVFLTPVVVHAARGRSADEEPFLYAAVFMANASSLLLPGSNLTNLLVLGPGRNTAGAFGARMLVMALTAVLVTTAGLFVIFRRRLGTHAPAPAARGGVGRRGMGLPCAAAAAVLTLALRNPAPEVLAIGIVAAGVYLARGRIDARAATRAVGPFSLAALFMMCVALGTIARSWNAPAELLDGSGALGTAALGASLSVLVNNLPAAVLLSAHPVADPSALLLGLNVGPNIAASGSLSALLWWRAARQVDARPSLLSFTRRGAPLAAAMLASLAAAALLT